MRETWYRMPDGRLADAALAGCREDGWPMIDGEPVAEKTPGVPWTVNVDPSEMEEPKPEPAKDADSDVTRDMDADKPKRAYVRRGKAD